MYFNRTHLSIETTSFDSWIESNDVYEAKNDIFLHHRHFNPCFRSSRRGNIPRGSWPRTPVLHWVAGIHPRLNPRSWEHITQNKSVTPSLINNYQTSLKKTDVERCERSSGTYSLRSGSLDLRGSVPSRVWHDCGRLGVEETCNVLKQNSQIIPLNFYMFYSSFTPLWEYMCCGWILRLYKISFRVRWITNWTIMNL